MANDFSQEFNRRLSLGAAFRFIEKLRQGRCSDVIFGFIIDDANFFAAFDHFGDLIESHIAGLVCVVEFAVLVAFDDLHFFHDSP